MDAVKRDEIKRQIEQLTCFVKSVYAGMARDIKISWRFAEGPDALGRMVEKSTVDYWRGNYGKHEEITIGVGDAYYGSDALSHMLYDHA